MSDTVTFLRLRPAESINELWAATRRREGTTTVEIARLTMEQRQEAIAGGLAPVAIGADTAEPLAWVVDPSEVAPLVAAGVAGWRLTVVDNGDRAAVIDTLARSKAAFLRTGRSKVGDAASIASLPGLDIQVSVFVDSPEEAARAVANGARDLLLRGWDTEGLGELRVALGGYHLVERGPLPPKVTVDAARTDLPPDLFTFYLAQVDGSGAARPRYEWAPGMNADAPIPPGRFSAQWGDELWRSHSYELDLSVLDSGFAGILRRSLEGQRPSRDEIERLFRARGDEVDAVAAVADVLRQRTNGEVVTFVVNRNINYTNLCTYKCGFCAFSKGPRSLNLRGEPYLMSIPQVVERAVEAWERGATEVCLQGGIHPDFTGDFYLSVVESIKHYVPEMHIHGFTPLEVWQGAETIGMSIRDYLLRLRDVGLGTLPGTAAEVLDDDVRLHLCPDKIRTAQWAEVMITAHELGLRSTGTIMFGHIDSPVSWANHFEVLRRIQRRTGGITEIVPLPFVHMGAPIFLRGRARPGPTWDEVLLVHSVARIAFDGLVDNIQASWVKLGLRAGGRLLQAGCNDLGGTLMDETISRAAGAAHGPEVGAEAMEELVRSIGRVPAQRNTLYELVASTLVTPREA
ncbi:MAG: 5-amino-6-(D-ribitylamino)uracil--L-tyrosine 4-hydroxyphenyl transferase CofH [Acidimicrobiia bacterium]|nr:5-amino-6-(D-ribitylamino)uracil--L-tyrosine 4-hydroxyphenyl transferase CofH [Acidimicrobiia bacterium]